MRQAILGWSMSMLPEGLIQARYPSHTPQVIPGFALFWILQVCDHHLFFNDNDLAHDLLPIVMRILNFFDRHVDSRGLLAKLPRRYWQFIDWTSEWVASSGSGGGVPVMGRASNTHTVASLLLSFVLQQAAQLAESLDETGMSNRLRTRSSILISGVNDNCFDGTYYLDSSIDCPRTRPSQHAQIFAVLSGAVSDARGRVIIKDAFAAGNSFTKASYVFMHYAFRAFAKVGLYDELWEEAWQPWYDMLRKNLSTWEEDSISQRSDCHAWGSVAIYEYLVEVSGVHPTAPGWKTVIFRPRLGMVSQLKCRVAMGRDNAAEVEWSTRKDGSVHVRLQFNLPTNLVSQLPGQPEVCHDLVRDVDLVYPPL